MEDHDDKDLELDKMQEEITTQICLRILERSCHTNNAIDQKILVSNDGTYGTSPVKRRRRRNAERELGRIKVKLDQDKADLTQLGLLNHFQNNQENFDAMIISSPAFFLDICGCGFDMNSSLALSPHIFARHNKFTSLFGDAFILKPNIFNSIHLQLVLFL